MFSLSWVGRKGPGILCAVVRWARQCHFSPQNLCCGRVAGGGGVGVLPFKRKGGKQILLLMHPLGGALSPTRAAGVLGHEDTISCLGKNV